MQSAVWSRDSLAVLGCYGSPGCSSVFACNTNVTVEDMEMSLMNEYIYNRKDRNHDITNS